MISYLGSNYYYFASVKIVQKLIRNYLRLSSDIISLTSNEEDYNVTIEEKIFITQQKYCITGEDYGVIWFRYI